MTYINSLNCLTVLWKPEIQPRVIAFISKFLSNGLARWPDWLFMFSLFHSVWTFSTQSVVCLSFCPKSSFGIPWLLRHYCPWKEPWESHDDAACRLSASFVLSSSGPLDCEREQNVISSPCSYNKYRFAPDVMVLLQAGCANMSQTKNDRVCCCLYFGVPVFVSILKLPDSQALLGINWYLSVQQATFLYEMRRCVSHYQSN